MITFCIIQELEEKGKLYKIDQYNGNSLWLADDATLRAGTKEDMKRNIEVLIEAAGKYGLQLNKKKTKILL